MELETETLKACPLCGAEALRAWLQVPDFESNTGVYGIDLCSSCGVGLTNPRPTPAALPALYASRTSADFPDARRSVSMRLRDFAIDRYLASRLINTGGRQQLLDYGCGDGALVRGMLRVARRQGFQADIDAVDFHSSAPIALQGLERVTYFDHAAWPSPSGRYDAIFLRHVLEHHPEPMQLLSQLRACLKAGGRLVIEVPNRSSRWGRLSGVYFGAWYVPRHLVHFDAEALRRAVIKAGFRVVALRRRHTPLLGMSLGYFLGRPISNVGPIGLLLYPLQVLVDTLSGRSTTLDAVLSRDA